PLFVVLAGVVLGPRLGALAIATYVSIGAAGAPVFSNGGAGLPWLLGPTGGYLLAMPAAAWVAGRIAGREGRAARTLAGLALGIATIYAGGVSQLVLLGGASLGQAVALGVAPFLAGDVTKVLLAFFSARVLRGTGVGRLCAHGGRAAPSPAPGCPRARAVSGWGGACCSSSRRACSSRWPSGSSCRRRRSPGRPRCWPEPWSAAG